QHGAALVAISVAIAISVPIAVAVAVPIAVAITVAVPIAVAVAVPIAVPGGCGPGVVVAGHEQGGEEGQREKLSLHDGVPLPSVVPVDTHIGSQSTKIGDTMVPLSPTLACTFCIPCRGDR